MQVQSINSDHGECYVTLRISVRHRAMALHREGLAHRWVVSVNEVEIRGGVGAAIGQAA